MKEVHTCIGKSWNGWHSITCGKRAKVEGTEGWYCLRHDPARKQLKVDARNLRWDAERKAREDAEAEGKALVAKLGAGGVVVWYGRRDITLTFDEARKLIVRLESRATA